MVLAKKLVTLLIALVILGLFPMTSLAAGSKNIKLYFNGTKVDTTVKGIKKKRTTYINSAFLSKYLNVVTNWNPVTNKLQLIFGKYEYQMRAGKSRYLLNGQKKYLQKSPLEIGDEVWLPLEFLLQLGLKVVRRTTHKLELKWARDYILAIENIKHEGRPALCIIGTKEFQTNTFMLNTPPRLVFDIQGVKAHFALDQDVVNDNPLVKRIRFRQKTKQSLRLVFDLERLIGYRIFQDPQNSKRLIIVFNYLIEAVNFFQKGQEKKILVKASAPPRFKSEKYPGQRLVIDFDGATLAGSNQPLPGDGTWIKQVRMSQFDKTTVRLVLDLMAEIPSFVHLSKKDPHLLEITTLQKVKGVFWIDEAQKSEVIIEADGGIIEQVRALPETQKLQIDLSYLQLAEGVAPPGQKKSDLIQGVEFWQLDPETVRLEIALGFNMDYKMFFSEDRRQLTFRFAKSPIIGRKIIVDAGHGGVDMGASGRQGTREKNVNLDVALRVKDRLERLGAIVILTRYDDTFISLYERAYVANHLMADLFVSIHTNSHPNLKVNGLEVYHYESSWRGKLLAKHILKRMVEHTGLASLGVKTNNFVVIRETQMVAVLVELGYLSNYREERIIQTEKFRIRATRGICQGIVDYYKRGPGAK